VVDLTGEEDFRNLIKEKANTLQKSIQLDQGPLLKLGLFKTAPGDYLLIAVHHLVFDGVSWRIIFEDFSSAYQQSEKGEEIEMPLKTTSYREWAEKLYHYANSQEFLKKELPYWGALEENDISTLVKPKALSGNSVKHGKNTAFALTKDMTSDLIKRVNAAYNTEINDILLTALGLAVKEWSGMEKVLIELEGHGREEIVENVDLTRTVGWFTSIYPVVIPVEGNADLGDYIKRTKDMLRNIPNKGIGYGILKYITSDENKKDIHFKLQPQIVFNYLGQFDQDIKTGFFQVADISPGYSISPDSQRLYPLEIVGIVVEGMLRISINYNNEAFDMQSIDKLKDLYEKNLQWIIDHCRQRETTELTVSDLSSNDFDQAEMESIFGELEDNFATV
jgi:non-ribosomal peptide synthase protein (TIGR01720 family)